MTVIACGPAGYAALYRSISLAQLSGGEKGRPVYDLEQVAAALRDQAVVLTAEVRPARP